MIPKHQDFTHLKKKLIQKNDMEVNGCEKGNDLGMMCVCSQAIENAQQTKSCRYVAFFFIRQVFRAIQKSSMELLRGIERYQDRLCGE